MILIALFIEFEIMHVPLIIPVGLTTICEDSRLQVIVAEGIFLELS